MRISSLALAAVFTGIAAPAFAAQDTPTVSNGIETVCTGVGSAKDDPRWNAYPVKLVFSNGAAEFVAGVHVALKKGGQTLVETDCDAPWVLFKLPGGKYTATATLVGGSAGAHSADILTDGGKQQKVEISFAHPSAP